MMAMQLLFLDSALLVTSLALPQIVDQCIPQRTMLFAWQRLLASEYGLVQVSSRLMINAELPQ